MNFEPQAVDTKSWRIWFVEALQLSTRKPVAFTALALGSAAIHYSPLGSVQLILFPLILSVGTLVASAADMKSPVPMEIRRTPAHAWFRLLLIGAAPVVLLMFVGFLLSFLSINSQPMPVEQSPLPFEIFAGGRSILVLMFLWLALFGGWIGWFMVPLTVNGQLSLLEAFEQSGEALALNAFVIRVVLSVAGIALIIAGVGASILAVPMLPIISCMMYVSYRHIWFDRLRNEPQKQPVMNREPANVVS